MCRHEKEGFFKKLVGCTPRSGSRSTCLQGHIIAQQAEANSSLLQLFGAQGGECTQDKKNEYQIEALNLV